MTGFKSMGEPPLGLVFLGDPLEKEARIHGLVEKMFL